MILSHFDHVIMFVEVDAEETLGCIRAFVGRWEVWPITKLVPTRAMTHARCN